MEISHEICNKGGALSSLKTHHNHLMSASSRLESRSSVITDSKSSSSSSVKPEPLDQMALYSSHFAAKAPSSAVTPHPASVLSGMSQQAHADALQ